MAIAESKVPAAGSILIWSPIECDRGKLEAALKGQGFAAKIPNHDAASVLAKSMILAAEEMLPCQIGETYYTKPRLKSVAIELYHLRKGDKQRQNEITRIATGLNQSVKDAFGADWLSVEHPAISQSRYREAVLRLSEQIRGSVPVESVTSMVSNEVVRLHGITIRGGVYYIPERTRVVMDRYVDCVLSAKSGGEGKPYILTQMGDHRTIAAIRDGAVRELEQRTLDIVEEIASCERMRSDGIATRRAQLSELRKTLGAYQSVLGDMATKVNDGIAAAEMALCIAVAKQSA